MKINYNCITSSAQKIYRSKSYHWKIQSKRPLYAQTHSRHPKRTSYIYHARRAPDLTKIPSPSSSIKNPQPRWKGALSCSRPCKRGVLRALEAATKCSQLTSHRTPIKSSQSWGNLLLFLPNQTILKPKFLISRNSSNSSSLWQQMKKLWPRVTRSASIFTWARNRRSATTTRSCRRYAQSNTRPPQPRKPSSARLLSLYHRRHAM